MRQGNIQAFNPPHMPQRFMTIRQTAAAGYDTEFHLRLLLKQGKLPGFFSGRTFKVNVPMFVELLDNESMAQS